MKILLLFFAIFDAFTWAASAAASDAVLTTLAAANNKLGLSIYKTIITGQDALNVFISPVSISSALSMVYLGSRGSTRKQMSDGLNFDEFSSDGELKSSFQTLLTGLDRVAGNSTLRTANRLYGSRRFEINSQFTADMKTYYGAELEQMDFIGNAEGARQAINRWVEEKTENKIMDLLGSGSVDANTALVIVSAIYFKGFWTNQFKKESTKPEKFFVGKTETTDVDMMQITKKKFKIMDVSELDCRVLEMGYSDGKIAMYIFLPTAVDNLASLEGAMDAGAIRGVLDRMEVTRAEPAHVRFPRFQLELTTDLKSVLQQLGVSDLFGDSADISGIGEQLFVSDAVHKAFIKVDEEGSEAAASTAMIITMRSSIRYEEVKEFFVDHPFMFCIVDQTSSTILFIGRIVRPTTN